MPQLPRHQEETSLRTRALLRLRSHAASRPGSGIGNIRAWTAPSSANDTRSRVRCLRSTCLKAGEWSLLALALFGALTSFASAQDPKPQVKAEIDRLQHSLKAKPVSDPDFASVNSMVDDALKGADEALNSDKLYLSLEKLLPAEDLLQGARILEEKSEAVKSGYPAFEAEWEKASRNLAALDEEAHQRNWSRAPVALQALSESAQGKSIPLLEGSRGFATSTKARDGLFYMGQAQGNAAFAKFTSTVRLIRTPASFPLRSYLPELQKLQEKTNAAFKPPRSIELHSRFIALNSALKLAEELDAQKFYAGSLYQYLEAARHFGMLDASPLDAIHQSSLETDIAAARKKLAASKQDDSLALLFLERAESQVAHSNGSAPTADEWRSARVILDQVLPAYFAALKFASPLRHASGKAVNITLVRWPYT